MPQNNANQQSGNQLLDDSMQRALTKVLMEMPDIHTKPQITPSDNSLLTSIFMPRGSMAVTNPFTGNITYNRAAMQGMNQNEIENTLAHELTHVRQTQDQPWYKTALEIFKPEPYSYNERPRELEAFQTERDRTLSHRLPFMSDPVSGGVDIPLPVVKRPVRR